MRVSSAMAGATAGLALWCTAGSLDAIDGPGGPVRVAMLPPIWVAGALGLGGAAMAIVGTVLVARLVSGRWRHVEREDGDVFVPLFATACLVLPLLPWLADVAPVWLVLGGPFATLVWFVVIGLVLRAAVMRVWRARRWHVTIAPQAATLAILLTSATVSGAAAARLVETPIFPGGDEPHYLVIAQSLWRDGDLRIENNHRRGDTLEYFPRPLKPDYLTRGVDREIYSIHPVGLAVLIAPVYALGGYRAVVVFLVALSAAAATCAWRLAARHADPPSARFAWLACALTAPWVFNSFTVYPEVPAALAVLVAFSLALRLDSAAGRRAMRSSATCGLAIAALPWLSSKYALMGVALGVVALGRLWLPGWSADPKTPAMPPSTIDRIAASLALAAAPVVSGTAWLLFFWTIWGKLSPSAPYGSQHAMDLSYLVAGGPGLFFDQEYGVIATAPVLLLPLFGLAGMLRRRGADRRLAVEIAFVGVSLLVTVAAFHIWWGGTAAVGRPVISVLLLLAVPCAWQVRTWAASRGLSSACWVLLAGSLAITATLALAQEGLLLVADRDGASRLLSWWSPAWPLWSIAPSFVVQPAARAGLITLVWVALIVACLQALRASVDRRLDGWATLAAAGAAFVALTGVASAVSPVSGRSPASLMDLSTRARSPLLDTFDAGRRPIALVFDPIRRVAPDDLARLVHFVARPDEPRASSAAALLHGARWAWPAGDYEVEVTAAPTALPITGSLGLQVGRAGPPLMVWGLDATPSTTWRGRFSLPVDVGFVGFKASPDLAARRPRIDVRPARVLDVSARPPSLDVVQARRFGRALVFFHDDNADPEPAGFWTRRDRATRISIDVADAGPPRLRLRSGPAPTIVIVRVDARSDALALPPNGHRELGLRGRGPWRVAIDTRGGFVPAETDPASRDVRGLGCWIEVIDGR